MTLTIIWFNITVYDIWFVYELKVIIFCVIGKSERDDIWIIALTSIAENNCQKMKQVSFSVSFLFPLINLNKSPPGALLDREKYSY